jgi:hypothetical protein
MKLPDNVKIMKAHEGVYRLAWPYGFTQTAVAHVYVDANGKVEQLKHDGELRDDCWHSSVIIRGPLDDTSPTVDMSPWRPMSTAPRDGTVIDLFHKTAGRLTETWWDDECWLATGETDEAYLGWMPVPQAPRMQA